MDNKGISPTSGTIALIFINLMIGGVFMVCFAGGAPEPPFDGMFALKGHRVGSDEFILKHIGGKTLISAFDYGFGPLEDNWRNLEIMLNGAALKNCIDSVISNGNVLSSAVGVNLSAGDIIRIGLPRDLKADDKIILIYRGGAQPVVLAEFKVS